MPFAHGGALRVYRQVGVPHREMTMSLADELVCTQVAGMFVHLVERGAAARPEVSI